MEINDIYKCSGKKYNGEKAIISLTSWKARVGTVGKTLFSLIKQCSGFHIVLVLSEEEFPKMEKELPDELMLFVKNNLIELLWIYKNYKAFKKVLFTMDKYRDVPVISADDGCIYKYNYAQELYNKWLNNKNKIISWAKFGIKEIPYGGGGYGILYPPKNKLSDYIYLLNKKQILDTNHDDAFYGIMSKILNIGWVFLDKHNKQSFIANDEDEKNGLFRNRKFDISKFYLLKNFLNECFSKSNENGISEKSKS